MTRTKLCLAPAALAWLIGLPGMAFIGCDNPTPSGESSSTVFYGRLPGAYEVCFYVGDDLASLMPSVVCDRDGETAYSFNIEGGTDSAGQPCDVGISWEEPVAIVDGRFEVLAPGEDAGVLFEGTIAGEMADGSAKEGSCSVRWDASTGPICREDDQATCNLLLECCDSIYLVPPILENCLEVVNQCDGVVCEQVLSGYTRCPQAPLCPVNEDPTGVCDALDTCCNTVDLDKEELDACLQTAAACNPDVCEIELITYPQCLQ